MRKHFPGEEHSVKEWAIRWTSPEDIADSVTMIDTEARAYRLLELGPYQTGEVVHRTVTYSPWKTKESDTVH